jgi:hypothetical protein
MSATLTPSQMSALKLLRADTGVEDLGADPTKTIAAVDARYITSSARVVFTMLKKVYPDNAEFIKQATDRAKVAKAVFLSQEPTEKQVAAHIPWETIITWRDSDEFKALPIQTRFLVGLYTYLPPQRIDYTPMKIVGRLPKAMEAGMNYAVMTKKTAKFVFHAYKTAKVFGDITHVVPKPLFDLLCEYLGDRRTGYLFQTGDVPITEVALATRLRTIFISKFSKVFGANNLRHSFITYQNKGAPSMSKLKEDALSMAHSVITHQSYRHITLE